MFSNSPNYSRSVRLIHAVLRFLEPKWNQTLVILMKGRLIKRRGNPPNKEGPTSSQGGATALKKEDI